MDKVLLEAPLQQLYNSTQREFGTKRSENAPKIRIKSYEYIPSVNDSILQVRFGFSSPSNSVYTSIIVFENVQFLDEPTPTSKVIETVDGTEYNIEPLNYNQLNAKVRCGCLDFYYRFATWNARDNSLYGDAPPPYVPKTDRQPVNPNKVAGLCKHLMQGVDFLRKQQILK